jgi:hypothetical protein
MVVNNQFREQRNWPLSIYTTLNAVEHTNIASICFRLTKCILNFLFRIITVT